MVYNSLIGNLRSDIMTKVYKTFRLSPEVLEQLESIEVSLKEQYKDLPLKMTKTFALEYAIKQCYEQFRKGSE